MTRTREHPSLAPGAQAPAQVRVLSAWRRWLMGKGTLGALREAQDEAVATVVSR